MEKKIKFEKNGFAFELRNFQKGICDVLSAEIIVNDASEGRHNLLSPIDMFRTEKFGTWTILIIAPKFTSESSLYVRMPSLVSFEIDEIAARTKIEKSAEEIIMDEKVEKLLLSATIPFVWQDEFRCDMTMSCIRIDVPSEILRGAVEKICEEIGLSHLKNEALNEIKHKIFTEKDMNQRLKDLILSFFEEELQEEKRIQYLLSQAVTRKEKILIRKYESPCDGSEVECTTDIISEWATAEGKIEYERTHTF